MAPVSSPCFWWLLVSFVSILTGSVAYTNPGVYPFNTLIVTWVSNNIQNEHVRSVGIPLLTSIANMSGLASSQIYPSKDKPRYVMGNSVSFGMEAVALISTGLMYLVIRRRNAKRAERVATGELSETEFKYVL
jgi:hypothetical protein